MAAPEVLEVRAETAGPVVERMGSLAAAQAGWITLQPGVHPDAPHDDVVRWLLSAGTALSRIPVTGSWRVEIHGQ
jgi:hypothetical protein